MDIEDKIGTCVVDLIIQINLQFDPDHVVRKLPFIGLWQERFRSCSMGHGSECHENCRFASAHSALASSTGIPDDRANTLSLQPASFCPHNKCMKINPSADLAAGVTPAGPENAGAGTLHGQHILIQRSTRTAMAVSA
ncbi:MAG: hypothetical protein IV101_13385 [Dechloromonas sp.]|nr:hypothetical protein [Dechloromonas sp.]